VRLLLFLLVLTGCASGLQATSCAYSTVCTRLDELPVIFLGEFVEERVEDVVRKWGTTRVRAYRVRVVESFRGLDPDVSTVKIYWHDRPGEGVERSPVGVYPPHSRDAHVFYLGSPRDGDFHTGRCGFAWTNVRKDSDELEIVREYFRGESDTAIFGRVWANGHPYGKFTQEDVVEGAVVTAQGSQEAFSGATDSWGRFRIEGIPADEYALSASAADWTMDEAPPIFRVNESGCAHYGINLIPNNEISGTVLGMDGEPEVGVNVSLLEAGPDYEERQRSKTDKQGRFRFKELDLGSYYVAVSPYGISGRTPYDPVFYPQAAELTSATPLHVDAGTRLVATDLTVGGRKSTRTVSVSIVMPDGELIEKTIWCAEVLPDGSDARANPPEIGRGRRDLTQTCEMLTDRSYRIGFRRLQDGTAAEAEDARLIIVPPGGRSLAYKFQLTEAAVARYLPGHEPARRLP